jgi:hypothetical protein
MVLSDAMLEDVRLSMLQARSKSLRKLSQQKNMPLDSAHKVIQLKMLVYCVQVMHKLWPTDPPARLCYYHWHSSVWTEQLKFISLLQNVTHHFQQHGMPKLVFGKVMILNKKFNFSDL